MKKNFKTIISTVLVITMLFAVMAPAAFASSNDDWGESSYVESAVKNSFTMKQGEYGFEARDDVRRFDAAVTAVRLLEEIRGKEIKGDEDDLEDFEDYREVRREFDDEELKMLGKAVKADILKGNLEEDGLYLYAEDSATRAEMAAFFARLLEEANLDIEDNYRAKNFTDLEDHWAEDEVDTVVETGLMEGYSSKRFGAEDEFSYQDMLIVFFRMSIDETDELDVEEFIDAINDCNWVYLSEEDDNGTYLKLREVDPLKVGESEKIKVSTDISGFSNSDAKWKSSDTSVLKVSSEGKLTAKSVGEAWISCEYENFKDRILVEVIKNNSSNNDNGDDDDKEVAPTKKMKATQSTISIEVGDSVDLDDYIINAPGAVKFDMESNNNIELNGSVVEAIKATKEGKNVIVEATSEDQKVEFSIRVTNMNITTNLKPEVKWAANNDTGTVTFTVKGINDDCEVLLNADSDYSLDLEETAANDSWRSYKVQNMEEIGGTTTLVVRVLIDGVQIWESDPEIFYFGD